MRKLFIHFRLDSFEFEIKDNKKVDYRLRLHTTNRLLSDKMYFRGSLRSKKPSESFSEDLLKTAIPSTFGFS